MNVQVIRKDGKPEWVVISYDDYLELLEPLQDAEDVKAIEAHLRALDAGEEEMIPSAVVDHLLDGANPIKVWREYRGLTGEDLARRVGISVADLSELESDSREGGVRLLASLARALDVSLDNLVVTADE